MGIEYKCANCGRKIEEGKFIAIIGVAPSAGLSTPIGRADTLFEEIGDIYCADCIQALGSEKLVAGVMGDNDFE